MSNRNILKYRYFNQKIFLSILLVVFIGFSAGCTEPWSGPGDFEESILIIDKKSAITDPFDYPVGNLTKNYISDIPVLLAATEEVLTNNLTDNQWEFQITHSEWDQILLFFQQSHLQPKEEGSKTWYVFIENVFLCYWLTKYIA
ncbi:MAG: hypothetical protein ACXADY_24865 [Candidatus Hodarchaeales archaeon]